MNTRLTSTYTITATLLFAVLTSGIAPVTVSAMSDNGAAAKEAAHVKRDEKRADKEAEQEDKVKELGQIKKDETVQAPAGDKPAETKQMQQEQKSVPVPEAKKDEAKASSNGNDSAQKNHTRYWESLGYGTCTKFDGVNSKVFTVPAPSSGKAYSLAVVKAGSTQSVANPNETDTAVKSGDVLTHSSGKDISHVIICVKSATTTTPEAPQTPQTPESPEAPAEEGQVLGEANTPGKGQGTPANLPSSLPITGSSYLTALAGLIASIGTYAAALRYQKRRLSVN